MEVILLGFRKLQRTFLFTSFDVRLGLTLLLPVIINNRSNWSATKLRIFCTASGVSELEKDHRGLVVVILVLFYLANLRFEMFKFRINIV